MDIKHKVLILTLSTGQGHNAVAKVLKDDLEKNGFQAYINEPLKKSNKKWNAFITKGYEVLAVKFPHIYDLVYKLSNLKFLWFILSKINCIFYRKNIYEIIKQQDPCLIISCHALLLESIYSLKRNEKISLPVISIVTDYKAHQSYINKCVDAYITASNAVNEKLIKNGISIDKINMYGIPVKDEFRTSINTDKHGIFTVLIIGGSMGMPKLKMSLKNILNIKDKIRLIVVCGKNEELKTQIDGICSEYKGDKLIEVYGYSTEVLRFMDESDVIVTKPGGITIAEAFARNLPIIIPYYIPGHEKENKDVLVDEGAALYIKNKSLSDEIEALISDRSKLNSLKENIYNINKNYSVQKIVDKASELISTYNVEINEGYNSDLKKESLNV